MVFGRDSTFTFALTDTGVEYWSAFRFLTKDKVLEEIRNWNYTRFPGISLVNVICDRNGPAYKQEVWYGSDEAKELIPDLAEVSLTHAILHIGSTPTKDNCIVVSETASGQTNIDADVMDAIIKKIGEDGK